MGGGKVGLEADDDVVKRRAGRGCACFVVPSVFMRSSSV